MEPDSQVVESPSSPGELELRRRAPQQELLFERLEYGKLCTSPDGPIEPGVESYPLASSPGFPEKLEPFCRPWIVGVAETAAGAPHATLVRCLRVGGRPIPLFCRVRRRSEDGEGAAGRQFWLARYLYSRDGGVDPLTVLAALEAERLRGITIKESKVRWSQIRAPRAPRPELDAALEAFLQPALEYVLSGIPVGVSGAMDEPTFFRWAAALWHLLPGGLREVFSAGWGGPAAEAPTLSLSWCLQMPPGVAAFDAGQDRWIPPGRVEVVGPGGGVRTRPFHQELLIPGRMFLRQAFERTEDGRAKLAGLEPRLDYLKGFDYAVLGPADEPPAVVDAHSLWSFELFRRPGHRSLDQARLLEVEHWLEGTWRGDPAALCLSTSGYFFPDARQRLFELGLRALESPEQRPRGDRIVWRSLAESPELRSPLSLSDLAAARLDLLQALAARDLSRVLACLDRALELEAAVDLPEGARERLDEDLTRSLDAWEAGFHRRHLAGEEVPEPYYTWAMAHATRLAVILATAEDPDAGRALDRLSDLAADPMVFTLRRFQRCEAPATEDGQTLRSMATGDAERLVQGLLRLWDLRSLETRDRRDRLCPWLALLEPLRSEDPLLTLASVGAEVEIALTPEERPKLVEQIRSHYVPSSLRLKVSSLLLRDWYYFHTYWESNNPGWRSLLNCWPPEAALALTGQERKTSDAEATSPEIERALAALRLPSPVLERRLEEHLGDLDLRAHNEKLFAKASGVLWDLCRRAIDYPGEVRAVDLCRGLALGELPESRLAPSPDRVSRAARLARSQRLQPPKGLWDRATDAWQLQLLLEAAPGADLRPSTQQLAALIPLRAWLRKHLELPGIHARRPAHFFLASRDFHELPFPDDRWKRELGATPLWAAFQGVPVRLQGDLRQALEAYSQDSPVLSQRLVELSIEYLRAQTERPYKPVDLEEVLRRLARAVIAPCMQDGGLLPEHAQLLVEAGDHKGVPKASWLRRRPGIQFLDDPFNALQVSDGEIIIARWFKPLLEIIWRERAQEALLAAIQEVAPEVWRR